MRGELAEGSGGGGTQPPSPSIHDLLENADLLGYFDAFKNVLKLRHAGDLCYVDQLDLDGIGMSRPEQKRLFREYAKYFPEEKQRKGFIGKIKKKMFGGEKGETTKSVVAGGGGKGGNKRAKVVDSKKGNEQLEQQKQGGCSSEQHPQQHIIPTERITLSKEIGHGEFGNVFQATWHINRASSSSGGGGDAIQVAVKRILPEKLISQPSSFLQEAAIMTRMQHENVIRLFGVVLDTKLVMLVSELAPCGSLLECLQSPPSATSPFSIATLCEFALQISRGMRYLSAQRLIHRDLAARNVLVSSPTKVKISDFGLSRSLGHGEDYYRSEFNASMKLPIAWCAPECINFLRFTSASDVWAYAVTLWEMFTFGATPWANMTGSQILHAIDTQRRKLERPEACPIQVYSSLMLRCWEWEAEKRPTFEQICDQLPALSPPLLITIAECRTRKEGHLEYEKGERIVLLDKHTVYPGFWLGASKSGKIGIFRPEATIAFLGAENPSAPSSGNGEKQLEMNGEKKKGAKKDGKKGEGKKTKEMISKPTGDLRHTAHLGADGRTFGVFNLDKNDLPLAKPPELPNLPTTIGHHSPDPPLISPLMCTSTISLAPPRPPKGTTTMGGGGQMSRSFCSESNGDLAPHALTPFPTIATVAQPQPPSLPPKPPRFRARPIPHLSPSPSSLQNANPPIAISPQCGQINYIEPIENKEANEEGASIIPKFPVDEERMSPVNRGKKEEKKEEEEDEEEFLRPVSICLEQLDQNQIATKTDRSRGNNRAEVEEGGEEEEKMMEILRGLQKDLDQFSMSTLGDCSDGRALLDGEQRRHQAFSGMRERREKEAIAALENSVPALRTSLAVAMDPEEFEKRAEEERRKTNKQLEKLEEGSGGGGGRGSPGTLRRILMGGGAAKVEEGRGRGGEMGNDDGDGDEELPRSKKEPMKNWSAEADEAYKMLVQCGHLLKMGGHPLLGMAPAAPSSGNNARTGLMPSSPVTEQIALTIQNPLNGKIVQRNSPIANEEYLNLNGAENGGRRRRVERAKEEYVNTADGHFSNGDNRPVIAKKSPPPPVPPKPRMKVNIRATNFNVETNFHA